MSNIQRCHLDIYSINHSKSYHNVYMKQLNYQKDCKTKSPQTLSIMKVGGSSKLQIYLQQIWICIKGKVYLCRHHHIIQQVQMTYQHISRSPKLRLLRRKITTITYYKQKGCGMNNRYHTIVDSEFVKIHLSVASKAACQTHSNDRCWLL